MSLWGDMTKMWNDEDDVTLCDASSDTGRYYRIWKIMITQTDERDRHEFMNISCFRDVLTVC